MAVLRVGRRAIPAVVGASGLALLLHNLDWTVVHRSIVVTGSWCVAIAAFDVLGLALDAAAIASFARPHGAISYRRAFVAQASGYALNQLTPGNSLGEPVKVALVARDAPRDAAIAAVVLYNVATVAVGVAAVVLGAPFALLAIELPAGLEWWLWIGIGALVLALAGVLLVVRRGPCATLIGAARRCRLVGIVRADRWRARVAAVDAHIRELGGPASRRGLAFACGSRAAGWLGTLVLLPAVGVPMEAPVVIAVLSLGILVSWLSDAMPLGLGIADGGQCALYAALGLAPAIGLAFAMIARARTCVTAALALAIAAILVGGEADRLSTRYSLDRALARDPRNGIESR